MLPSQLVQRIGGFLLFLAGTAVAAWSWHSALTEGRFDTRLACLGPTVAIAGFGLLLAPMDLEWLRRTHGVHKPSKFSHYPPAWRAIFVFAILGGIANYVTLTTFHRWL